MIAIYNEGKSYGHWEGRLAIMNIPSCNIQGEYKSGAEKQIKKYKGSAVDYIQKDWIKKMEIKSLYGKNYISIKDLVKCGFGYPKKGTPVVIISSYFFDLDNGSMWYKFFEKKEGWDSVFVSPWATEIGKKHKDESTVYVEFSKNTFTFNF